MKVYSLPKELADTLPKYDHTNAAWDVMDAQEDAHKESVKQWLISYGYTGKNTGKVVSFYVADGYAQYMLAEGSTSCLITLPYCDGYQYPDVKFLPKSEILKRIKQEEKFQNLPRMGV